VKALDRSPVWKQPVVLNEFFGRLELEDQVASLDRSPVWKQPKVLDEFFGRMQLEQKVETIERSPVWKQPVELRPILESVPAEIRSDMFGRLEYAVQAATLEDAYAGQAMEM
jgi:hypothetical protein